MISNVCAIPVVLICGKLGDKIKPKVFIPTTILFQMVVMGAYMFIKDPTKWPAYVCAAFQVGSGLSIIVSMQAYLLKRVPKMIRGMVYSFVGACSCFGTIVYLQLEKVTTQKIGNNMTFGSIIIIDILVLVPLLIFMAFNLYG
jgi:hypothetical protein